MGGGGLALFLFNLFFQGLSFLHLDITLYTLFAKLCFAFVFEEKLFFPATIILSNKVILR